MEIAVDVRSQGPLTGVRVVEIGALGPAPFACMLLSDLGARITRVDRCAADFLAGGGDPRFDFLLRGRERICIDVKADRGREIVMRLVAESDLFVEGFRPGVMERLGLGPTECLEQNPRLVYGRMTGWGQSGPLAGVAGHDVNYIALTGALHAIGQADGAPIVPLNLLGDFGGGAMYLVVGLLAGLLESRLSGRGQVVDAAMVDGVTSLMTPVHGAFAAGFWRDERGANLLDGGAPFYSVYETGDHKYVAVGAIEPKFFVALLDKLGVGTEDVRAQYDRDEWPRLRETLTAAFRTKTRDEWCSIFEGSDACVSPVLSLSEVPGHTHLRSREAFEPIDGAEQPAPTPRFSRTPGAISRAGVPAGFDTRDVLGRIGFTPDDVDELVEAGVVRCG